MYHQSVQCTYRDMDRDQKLQFQEHIKYAADRCTKLIHILSRAAKLSRGIKSGAIATIYKGAILPLLTHGAPVWIDAMKYEHNRQKYEG